MSEDRHERPADDHPGYAPGGAHGHPGRGDVTRDRFPEDALNDHPPGTSWALGADQHERRPDAAGGAGLNGEEALRRLLHDAADGLEPRAGALEEIRQAIPVRRARRRNALVGAGAAALVVGVALPLMQAGVVPGPLNDDNVGNAAQSQHQDATAERGEPGEFGDGGDGGTGQEGDRSDGYRGGVEDDPSDPASGRDGSPSPSRDDLSSTAPSCGPDQLGEGEAEVGDPDGQGRIYGSFELKNVSDQTCRVSNGDGLTANGVGKVPTSDVQVLDHTPGGRASELPDPSRQDGPVILRPGDTYEVKFAWIPSPENEGAACTPSEGGDVKPTEPPPEGGDKAPGDGGESEGGDGDGDGGPGESGGTGGAGQEGLKALGHGEIEDGGEESAIILNYKPASGEPSIPAAYLNSSCSGTVYRTEPMAAS